MTMILSLGARKDWLDKLRKLWGQSRKKLLGFKPAAIYEKRNIIFDRRLSLSHFTREIPA